VHILITGHRGFIGQNMINALKDDHGLSFYEWGDPDYDLDGVDFVIHLGAISSTAYRDVRQIMKQNYHFTVELMEACSARQIPIQIASSASIYGPDNTTFVESDPPDPRTPYAWTKYLVEEYARTHFLNCPVQLFRYFNVYGPHEDHKGDQASPYHKFQAQKDRGEKIRLFEGSENFKRDFVHVDTVINAHLRFMDLPVSGVWNIGTGTAKSFVEVAEEIGGEVEFIPMPEVLKSGYQAYTCASVAKFLSTISGS